MTPVRCNNTPIGCCWKVKKCWKGELKWVGVDMELYLEKTMNMFCKEGKWRDNCIRQVRQIFHLIMQGGCNLQPHGHLFSKTKEWWLQLVFLINNTQQTKRKNCQLKRNTNSFTQKKRQITHLDVQPNTLTQWILHFWGK